MHVQQYFKLIDFAFPHAFLFSPQIFLDYSSQSLLPRQVFEQALLFLIVVKLSCPSHSKIFAFIFLILIILILISFTILFLIFLFFFLQVQLEEAFLLIYISS
jgi:hypothetical protein